MPPRRRVRNLCKQCYHFYLDHCYNCCTNKLHYWHCPVLNCILIPIQPFFCIQHLIQNPDGYCQTPACVKEEDLKDSKRCEKHCINKDHAWHCKFYGCEEKTHDDYDGETSNFCFKHCEKLRHCDVCKKRSHEGSSLCSYHCILPGHDHCTHIGCEKLKHKGERTLDLCLNHCTEKGHGHCTYIGCEKLKHKGEGTLYLCLNHCTEKGHGHCTYIGCEKNPHPGGIYCTLHCQEKDHKHCSVIYVKIMHIMKVVVKNIVEKKDMDIV